MKLPSLLCLFTLTSATFAAEPREIISSFFSHFPKDQLEEAVDGIFATNPWMDRKEDQKTNFRNSLRSLTSLVGEFHGVDYVAERRMGDNLIAYTYIARYARQPVRFEFIFYKPHEDWLVYSFTYDDEVDDDLKKAMRSQVAEGRF